MRILLQHKKTGQYFRDIDSWVRDPGAAMDFLSSTTAIEFCVNNKIDDVQLVLKFVEQQYDIVMRLDQAHDLYDRRVQPG
ncbi:MAG TPA: hypothetical protein VKY92_21015 [Verrucomicrobiae bacterium]|nr:hypothetical protein [Verrucomicrobiae bacterium]